MRFPFGETVTLHKREIVGEDDYGNDVIAETATPVPGVPVWPRTSAETVQARDQVVDGLWALLPAEHDPSAVDAVTVRGRRYEVDGEPGRLLSPLTGTDAGYQVALRRVTG